MEKVVKLFNVESPDVCNHVQRDKNYRKVHLLIL